MQTLPLKTFRRNPERIRGSEDGGGLRVLDHRTTVTSTRSLGTASVPRRLARHLHASRGGNAANELLVSDHSFKNTAKYFMQ